jgi:hypothetical protein
VVLMSSTAQSSMKAGKGKPLPTLTADQLTELLGMLPDVDSVELKLSVTETSRRSVLERLGLDPLDAQIRQIVFFDTPDLALNQRGVVLRARRIQRKPGDSVVKLRPVQPAQLSPDVRQSPGFGVEVDAMPGGFVCSGAMKAEVDDALALQVLRGEKPIRRLFSRPQRALFADHAPGDIRLDDLVILGPINILKLKFAPDGGRTLVLSGRLTDPRALSQVPARRSIHGGGRDQGVPGETRRRPRRTAADQDARRSYVLRRGGRAPASRRGLKTERNHIDGQRRAFGAAESGEEEAWQRLPVDPDPGGADLG